MMIVVYMDINDFWVFLDAFIHDFKDIVAYFVFVFIELFHYVMEDGMDMLLLIIEEGEVVVALFDLCFS